MGNVASPPAIGCGFAGKGCPVTALLKAPLRCAATPSTWVGSLLTAWAIGLGVAWMQLHAWQTRLSATLVELRTDAQFRARAAMHRSGADPEYCRRKALSLLSAAETLRDDALWTTFIPGSWRAFDDLEERVAARIEQEFGLIVVETVRRELLARAAQLSGMAMRHEDGSLAGDCRGPGMDTTQRRLSASPQDLPEYAALRDFLTRLEPLDRAAQAFLALQQSPTADAEQLRSLVTYTLGVEPPGPLTRSVRLFRDNEEVVVQPVLTHAALQAAARCALGKGVAALHARLLANNELLTLEEAYLQHSAGIFERQGRGLGFERTVERLRGVLAVLDDQELLLSRGGNAWMRAPAPDLGPGYDEMLQRVAATPLLGEQAAAQWKAQSTLAFAQFRRHFDQLYGNRRAPGVVWLADAGRFGLSPERSALRDGLYALLQESWMSDDAPAAAGSAVAWDLTGSVMEAQSLVDARQRFVQDTLPRFPPAVRPAVQRIVDARLGELAYEHAFRALKAARPAQPDLLPDSFTASLLREQVMQVRALLARLGSPALGERLLAQIGPEGASVLREQLSD